MIDFIKRKKADHALKNNRRKRTFHNLETMERVLVLFHYKDWMQIQLVAKDLERMGKKVMLWTVESLDETTVNIKIPLTMRVLTAEDFSKISFLKSKTEDEYKGLKYDTLIDFCQDDGAGIEYLSYLLAINNAEFCLGNRSSVENLYDMIVYQKKGKDILETFGQMKFYLQSIRL